MKPIALYYLGILDDVRAAARAMGYAIGVHGSLSRDLDLIAAPWRDDAKNADDLAMAIAFAVNGVCATQAAETRAHGRRLYIIYFQSKEGKVPGAYIDLSVMPTAEPFPKDHPELKEGEK